MSFLLRELRFAGAALLLTLSCVDRAEPPGARPASSSAIVRVGALSAEAPVVSASAPRVPSAAPGSIEDNLPFGPTGLKIASTALRTWIYTDVGPKRTRYGHLRAGAVVDARGPEIKNDGCDGGWYRVNPRGFVCVGMGATLDVQHPIVRASDVRPVRGHALPYVYALAEDNPPLLYFKLPSSKQMQESEGGDVAGHAAAWRERSRVSGLLETLGELQSPPDYLQQGAKLDKPYGAKQPLRFLYHAGRSSPDSGFAMTRLFEWEKRAFGLTTELDLVPLDRTRVVRASDFHGVELAPGEGLPVGFVEPPYAQRYELRADGQFAPTTTLRRREGVKLTGVTRTGGMLEARDGSWAVESQLRMIRPRTSFPSFATGDRKWIDISIREQSLVAYLGQRPVYVTLVSSGRGGMADPEKVEEATVRGTFMIFQKDVSSTMDGDEDRADSYALHDVPFVQYFHKGYALHGTYWHDEFGKIRSHGCVNLAPIDAAWLFEWTDPVVPPEWHGVINKERGTVVLVRP
ncbi:MAG TPA: L,D-transpeptidase [Polyangiaceae bacterium]|nr:L,D-transpeptidase [Polyangiaceae bacterium]